MAFVIRYLNSGGAERAALNMASAASRSACVVIAERAGGDLVSDPLADRVVTASRRLSDAGGRAGRIARLVKTLHAVRAEIVVSMLSPIVTAGAARVLDLPVIHWLQAPWSRTVEITGRRPRAVVQRAMLRAAAGRRSLIAATTPGLADECAALGIARDRLAVLPNGLVIPDRPRSGLDAPPEQATIVSVGRLEAPKRHDITIRAFAEVAHQRNVRLVIVGSGTAEGELRGLATALGVADRVQFTGFVPTAQTHLMTADIFTLSTEYEGFGNVIVEALGCGLPVIVSDVPYGPRFILDDGRYGELVPPGSVTGLETAFRRTLDRLPLDRPTAEQLNRRAHSFDLKRVAERFDELVDLVRHRATTVPAAYRKWD